MASVLDRLNLTCGFWWYLNWEVCYWLGKKRGDGKTVRIVEGNTTLRERRWWDHVHA